MPDEIRSSRNLSGLSLDKHAVIAIVLALITAAAILVWIYQVNHALQLKIEAAEVWSDYQVRIAKATIEEDPNLKQQYAEEQDVLRRHASELKDMSSSAKYAARLSGFAALFVLLGTVAAVVALFSKTTYLSYAGILLSVIGLGFAIRALF